MQSRYLSHTQNESVEFLNRYKDDRSGEFIKQLPSLSSEALTELFRNDTGIIRSYFRANLEMNTVDDISRIYDRIKRAYDSSRLSPEENEKKFKHFTNLFMKGILSEAQAVKDFVAAYEIDKLAERFPAFKERIFWVRDKRELELKIYSAQQVSRPGRYTEHQLDPLPTKEDVQSMLEGRPDSKYKSEIFRRPGQVLKIADAYPELEKPLLSMVRTLSSELFFRLIGDLKDRELEIKAQEKGASRTEKLLKNDQRLKTVVTSFESRYRADKPIIDEMQADYPELVEWYRGKGQVLSPSLQAPSASAASGSAVSSQGSLGDNKSSLFAHSSRQSSPQTPAVTETDLSDFFKCPITREIMKDPVVTDDGTAYEREAIVRWLRDTGTSPITREVANGVTTDLVLKKIINECHQDPQADLSKNFLCPITHKIMSDPVLADDGWTYDREAIEKALRQSGNINPATGMAPRPLIPNRALKDMIEQYHRHEAQLRETPTSTAPR